MNDTTEGVLQFIKSFLTEHGYSPTVREIVRLKAKCHSLAHGIKEV